MPTATTTAISSSNPDVQAPTSGWRITGGTASDPLTISDIMANTDIAAIWSYDSTTGVVTRAETNPSAKTVIFGGYAPAENVVGGSTNTDVTFGSGKIPDWLSTSGKLRYKGVDAEIETISSNGLSLTVDGTWSDTTLSTSEKITFIDPQNITRDCYVNLVGVKFALLSNTGTDYASQDKGNNTDKIKFSAKCEVVFGIDVDDANAQEAGNVDIYAENYSYNFYTPDEIFDEQAKVTCYSYMRAYLLGNSRMAWCNRHPDSDIRLLVVESPSNVSPYTAGAATQVPWIMFDLDVNSIDFVFYGSRLAFRTQYFPGGMQSNYLEMRTCIVPELNTNARMIFYWNKIPGGGPYVIDNLQTIKRVGDTAQPTIGVQYAGGFNQTRKFIFRRYGGVLGTAGWEFSNDTANMLVEAEQRFNFSLLDSSASALTGRLIVQSRSYSHTFTVDADDSDLEDAAISTTDYATEQAYSSVSTQSVDIVVMAAACGSNNNQNFRSSGDTDSRIAFQDMAQARYSVWVWGYHVIWETALTITEGNSENEVVVVMATDTDLSSATAADVPSVASSSDDIYDMIVKYAHDNDENVLGSVTAGRLNLTSPNLWLGTSASTLGNVTQTVSDVSLSLTGTGGLEIAATGALATFALGSFEGFQLDISNSSDFNGSYTISSVTSTTITVSTDLNTGADQTGDVSFTILTIPCSSTVAQGTAIRSIAVTGDVYIASTGADIQFPFIDSNGIGILFSGLPADHEGAVIAWPKSQGETDRSNSVSGAIPSSDSTSTALTLVLDQDTEYYYVMDAHSHTRTTIAEIDTGSSLHAIGILSKIQDAAGNDLVPKASALTSDETAEAALVTWGASYIDLEASTDDPAISFNALAYAIEAGQSTTTAMASLIYPARIENGRIIFPSSSSQKWRRKSGETDIPDIESTSIGKDGSEDSGDYIDFSNGGIKYKSQPPVAVTVIGTTESDFEGYLSNSATLGAIKSDTTEIDNVVASLPARATSPTKAVIGSSGNYGWSFTGTDDFSGTITIDSTDYTFTLQTFGGGITSFSMYYILTEINTLNSGNAPVHAYATSDGALIIETLAKGADANMILSGAAFEDILGFAEDATFSGSSGLETVTVSEIVHAVQISQDQIDFNEKMSAVPTSTKSTYQADVSILTDGTNGLAAILAAVESVQVDVDVDVSPLTDETYGLSALQTLIAAIPTSNPSTANIVQAIQAADFESGEGGATIEEQFASIKTAISAIPTSSPDVSLLTDTTSGLAAIKTAVDAIPTSTPTASEIVTAIQAADFDEGSGTNTLAQVLAALATSVGAIQTNNPTASEIATAIFGREINSNTDALTFAETIQVMAAVLAGRATVSGNDVSFYTPGDDTAVMTISVGPADGQRAEPALTI